MARQSHPTILLTRPAQQSQRFAAQIGGAVISPLMRPEFSTPHLPREDFSAIVLTSETGAEAAGRISATGAPLPKRAFCVGNRTADAAQKLGFEASSAAGDADDLLAHILRAQPAGQVLLLRGQDSAGDLQNRLVLAGIPTVSLVIYRQIALQLNDEAITILQGAAPVILPVFSPRSARILAAELRRIAAVAPIWLAALSAAVADGFDFPTVRTEIALRPDSAAMRAAIDALLRAG
ncbi:uroporphyrinogen III methyltransferase [Cypionkella aquatica]|uniref:Uroporphyrinogen III methyltransferase n=1 Tax=Cypionkella aquatica TaxID=1756042 RepID=A0AA37U644_9RHOB|nr:uroporphyrinogen-III synthase [Cypionkella aquatica]GLS86216.1 uroporphyrinogen III methyltransferase [Cypionkella aquatica]